MNTTINALASSETTEKSVRILVVDDHDDLRMMLNIVMEQRSYAVATAKSGREAIEVAEKFLPHVVISDIGMPGMNGYEMMTALRGKDNLTPFKSIALTGYDRDDDHDRAREAGYDAHLCKPIDFNSLFETIQKLTLPHSSDAVS